MHAMGTKYFKGKYYSTFRRQVLDEVKGCRHASGGKGHGKGKASTGKVNQYKPNQY